MTREQSAAASATGKARQAARDAGRQVPRLRRKYPALDHLIRANEAFNERYGNHYAAAIAYFSILSLVPVLMVGFAIASFILAGNPMLLAELRAGVAAGAPPGLGETLSEVVQTAVDARGTVGVLGFLLALYAGINWMRNLRDALTAQWGQDKPKLPLLSGTLKDLLALFGLGAALIVSFALTAASGAAGNALLQLLDVDTVLAARVLLTVITLGLALVANWLVFLWVISRLPRQPVSTRSAVKGAVIAAVGFEILKQLASVLLAGAVTSPTGALFGPIIGLLVFAYLISRFLLFVTAWTATARENVVETVPAPGPAAIRPLVHVRRGPSPQHAAGLLGLGAVLGGALWSRRRGGER